MFRNVNTLDDKINLMKSVSHLRSETRDDLLKERMGETTMQEDLGKLFKPITQELAKEKQILETIVKQNNDRPAAAVNSTNSDTNINPDNLLNDQDKDILRKYKLLLPSEVMGKNMDIEEFLKDVYDVMNAQKLGAMKGRNKTDPTTGLAPKEVLDARKRYIAALKGLGTVRKYIPTAGKPGTSTGTGIRTGKGLKVKNGKFGDLTINPEKLSTGKLEVYKGNKKVLSKTLDKDLFELLTKRYNKQKQYSNDSIATFNKLLELSGIPTMNVKSEKANLKAVYYHDPNELISRLQELISAKSAGNTGVDNEINTVLDELLEIGQIKNNEYRKIYKNIFG
jgi:hypothetical protein